LLNIADLAHVLRYFVTILLFLLSINTQLFVCIFTQEN